MASKYQGQSRVIIPAGEVGAYTVCPEAWRLRSIKGVNKANKEAFKEGQKLHREWAEKFDQAASLGQGVKILVLLLGIALILSFWLHLL